MKQLKISGYSLGAALLLLTACNDGLDFETGTGTISPLVSYDPTVITARASNSRAAEIGDLTVTELSLTLTSEDGSVNETFPAGSFPTDRNFKVGKYTLTASYGDPEEEGFEKPAVYGEAELSVNEGKATQVALTATPSKAMVSLTFDESLTDYMTSVSAKLHSAGGNYIDYGATETRPVYLKPGTVSLSVDFVKPNGKGATLVVNEFEAKAQHHYKVALALGGDGYATETITVKYDDLLEEEEVLVDISDLVLSTPAPTVTPNGFTDGELFTIVEGDPISVSPRFDIRAQGGIASAVLTTRAPQFIAAGWPAEIDLTKASAAEQAKLVELGFKDLGIFRNPGTMAAFDLSAVASHVPASGLAADPCEFTLVVADKNGKQSDPVGFKLKVEELVLLLEATARLYNEGDATAQAYITYNGTTDIKQAVKVSYLTVRGVWAETTIASATAGENSRYTAEVNIPADAQTPVQLKATCASLATDPIKIGLAPVIAASANDIFATSGWFSLSHPEYDCASKTISLEASTDGTNFSKVNGTQSGAEFHATGLAANTAYTFRAKVGDVYSNTISMRTEAATQLGNSDMETWSKNDVKDLYTWTNYTPGSPWASNGYLSLANHGGGQKASAAESIQQTSDCHGGSNAAMIRTVAWMATALTPWNDSHFLACELFTGTFENSTNNYGTSFASRPSAVKFWYKYSAHNDGDKGLAEAKVLDAAGNVIASGTLNLDPASAYTQKSINLTYARGAAKAASIQVRFRSSNTDAYLNKNGVSGGSTKGYFGSTLYVDDIELAY